MPRVSRSLCTAGLSLVAAVLVSTACSDDNNPSTPTVSVAVDPTAINIAPAGSGVSTASISRGGGFNGAANLTSAGAPSGMTVTFTPSTVPAGASESIIEVTATAAVVPGSYDLDITASASGVTASTTTLTVVVVGADVGGFSLAAAPSAVSATAGGAAVTSTITITRTAPFTGAVSFTATGAPSGLAATFTPVSATDVSTVLSVQAGSSVANGTYPITVRGHGTGVADATTIVTVTVSGSSAAGIALAVSPTSLTIAAGGTSATSTATITRNGGFTGNVNLALTGAPAGLTASVAPTATTGNTATITVQAGSGLAAGTYNLTLTGSGTGISNGTATLPVTVTGAGGGGGNVVYTFCAADAPTWVAMQSGGGGWAQVTPTAGSTYNLNFTSNTGGLAFVSTDASGSQLTILNASLSDFTNAAAVVNYGGCGSKTVHGSVANADGAALVSLGFAFTNVLPVSTTFDIENVAAGPQDLVAVNFDALIGYLTRKVILRRAQDIADGGTIPVLDFDAAESFVPGGSTVSVANLGSDEAQVLSAFFGVRGSTFAPITLFGGITSASAPHEYFTIPSAQLQANEIQLLQASVTNASNANVGRLAGIYFREAAVRTITVGPALSTPTVTKLYTTPYVQPRVSLASQAEYNKLIMADFTQTGRQVTMIATTNYFGSLPATWNIVVPDFTGVTGWNDAWGLANTGINWEVSAQGGAISFLDGTIADGATTQSASVRSASPLLRTARINRGSDPGGYLQARLDQAMKASYPTQ